MMRPGDRDILERAQEHETAHQDDEYYLGWEWDNIRAKPQTLNRLLLDGLIELRFKSNSSRSYLLTDEGRQALRGTSSEGRQTPLVTPDDIFAPIVGCEDIKEALQMIAFAGRRFNVLMEGPPATAKSLFLRGLARVPGAYMATGSRVTAAGLTEALDLYRPPILVLDEADKTPQLALSVLLSVMEGGLVTVTKHGTHESFQVECSVVGACNTSSRMPPELRSRFGVHLHLSPYTEDEFLEVSRRVLIRDHEDMDEDLALEIGQAVWDHLDRDFRTASSLAQMLKEPTLEEVQRWTTFLTKYR